MRDGYAINPESGRIISKSTSKYRKLVKLGLINNDESNLKKVEKVEKVEKEATQSPKELKKVEKVEKVQDEYSEEKLQKLLVSKSTDIISQNMDKFMDTHKLTDDQVDIMVRKLLYEKLMGQKSKKEPKKEKTKTKKSKYKLRKAESSEDSDSD
jgi:uncharacterized protein YbcC (UPF0753/DUF2309 family)